MTDIHNMTKDQLLVFLTDCLLWRASVTGEIKFGTNDQSIEDLEDRARAGNDSFEDLVDRVVELTGKQVEPDPRDVRAAERSQRSKHKASMRLDKINEQIKQQEGR